MEITDPICLISKETMIRANLWTFWTSNREAIGHDRRKKKSSGEKWTFEICSNFYM